MSETGAYPQQTTCMTDSKANHNDRAGDNEVLPGYTSQLLRDEWGSNLPGR